MAKYIKSMSVGIDLGTTTSVVSILENEGANIRVLDIAESIEGRHTKRGTLFRSAVNVKYDLVGPEADTDEFRNTTFFNLKKKFIESAKEKINDKARGSITPFEYQKRILDAMFVKSMLLISNEEDFEIELADVTITVPTDFKTAHRKVMLELAQESKWGIASDIHIIDEPIAASMAKLHSNPGDIDANWITYDFGGGTFDVSLLETIDLEDTKVHKVHINRGDLNLGGYQLDEVIWDMAVESIEEDDVKMELASDHMFAKELKTSFIDNSGEIKMMLDHEKEYSDVLKVKTKNYGTQIITITINRDEYWDRIKQYVDKTIDYSKEVLDFAIENNLKVSGINFVGGSTKDPHIRKYVKKELKIKKSYFSKPEEVVSMGAAIKSGIEDQGMTKITSAVMDSVSSPIGFTKADGTIQWVLAEGDPLPTTKTFRMSGVNPGQTGIAFSFVEASKMYYGLEQLQGNFHVSTEIEMRGFRSMAERPIFIIEVQIDEDKIANVRIMQEGTSIIKELNNYNIFAQARMDVARDRKDSLMYEATGFAEASVSGFADSSDISERLSVALEELNNAVRERPDLASTDELISISKGAHEALDSGDEEQMFVWLYRVLAQAELI